MRILVTGAAGFIGSNLTDRLLASGHAVLGLDNFNDFYDPELKRRNLKSAQASPNFEGVTGDILDEALLDSVFSRFKPERIVHLAAWAGVRPSIQRPALYQKVNVEGTTNLLERARHNGIRHFVFASSSSVYGDRVEVPFRETDNVDYPISPYAATKKAGELLCHTWHHLFGMHVACLRFFTVYGPRQRPEMAIHQFTRLIEDGLPVPMFGDGSTSRDYTFIEDIVDGIMAAIERVQGYRVYNLGESQTISLRDLIALIGRHVGKTPHIDQRPLQPGDVTRTFADVSRARAELGYDPHVGVDEGVRRFVEWFRADRAGAGR